MSQDKQSRLRAAYAQLEALANDLPPIAFDHDAASYNRIVDEFIDLGYDAEQFKIHPEDLFRPVASISGTGQKTYRETPQVHYHVLDRKVKSLLTFLKLTHEAAIVEVKLPRVSSER